MARGEAHIKTTIWKDDDWRSLSFAAQWLYECILSQSDLSWCGVLTWSPGRFVRYARDLTRSKVETAHKELAKARFVVVDEETDELWVRGFVRWERVCDKPNVLTAASHDLAEVHSQLIRDGLVEQFRDGLVEANPERFPKSLLKRFHHAFLELFPDRFRDGPLEDHGARGKGQGITSSSPPPPDESTEPPAAEEEELSEPTNDQPTNGQSTPRDVADVVALRKLARRQGPPIADRRRWLAKVAGDLLDVSADEIEMLLAGGRTAEQAAAIIDPDPTEPDAVKRCDECGSTASQPHGVACAQHPTNWHAAREAEAERLAIGL